MLGIDDAIAAGLKIVDKFVPDPAMKAKAESELRADLMAWDKGQMTVNATEAANPSLFVSGWRPAIGWTCGIAIAYQYALVPILTWIASMAHLVLPEAPPLDANLWELMTAMLGIAGLRTFEKVKGVA